MDKVNKFLFEFKNFLKISCWIHNFNIKKYDENVFQLYLKIRTHAVSFILYFSQISRSG